MYYIRHTKVTRKTFRVHEGVKIDDLKAYLQSKYPIVHRESAYVTFIYKLASGLIYRSLLIELI